MEEKKPKNSFCLLEMLSVHINVRKYLRVNQQRAQDCMDIEDKKMKMTQSPDKQRPFVGALIRQPFTITTFQIAGALQETVFNHMNSMSYHGSDLFYFHSPTKS
jgi:hypothetical protein